MALKEFEILPKFKIQRLLKEYEVGCCEKKRRLIERIRVRKPVKSAKEILTEAFAKDSNLILEDSVHKLKFKVEAIRPEGVEVIALKNRKRYLFPWKVFEV